MKEIAYPCFLGAMDLTEDYFWRNIFEDLAYGLCPYGTYIYNGTLYCNTRDKQFSYQFANKPTREIYDAVVHYFKTKLSLSPANDFMSIREQMERSLSISQYSEWKEIKRKNIKSILVVNYVLDLAAACKLSMLKTQRLLNSISLMFTFKLITADDVVFDSSLGRIVHIHGIDVGEKT